MLETTNQSSSTTRHARPSSLACTECRKHHVKCDALKPSCSRCVASGLNCNYLPSRRGGRKKTRDGGANQQSRSDDSRMTDSSSSHMNQSNLSTSQPIHEEDSIAPNLQAQSCQTTNLVGESGNHFNTIWRGTILDSESSQIEHRSSLGSRFLCRDEDNNSPFDNRLVKLYYQHFHPAHPILVPESLYEGQNYPIYLQQVVQFVGSHYSSLVSSDSLRVTTSAELASNNDKSPYLVQARLICSIALCARGESKESQTILGQAIDLALELRMQRADFALAYGSEPFEAESLRRTWWELFIVDVFMAVLHQKDTFRCGSVSYDVALPCEESVYEDHSYIPEPHSLAAFNSRMFAEEEANFSSFSYRIEAVRILARVLTLNSLQDCHHDHIQAVENALVSWTNHLPSSKTDIVDTYGDVDEMLFQAYMTIHYAAMLLHLPRSNLRPKFPATNTLICPAPPSRLSPSFTRHVHDIKATDASKQLSNLISVSPRVHKHTPFMICGLVLCGVVQLATCCSHSHDCLEHHHNRVILVLGCLKTLSRTWLMAKNAHQHVRRAAAEIFSARMESMTPQTQLSRPLDGDTVSGSIPTDDNGWFSAMASDIQGLSTLGTSTSYIDPTCSNTYLLNTVSDFDLV